MQALITILDGITETSMPFNEFVLYRDKHYPDERQILVICGAKRDFPKIKIPTEIEVVYTGRNIYHIRKSIQHILAELNNDNIPYSFHLHQVQSGILAEIAMLGTGFRKKTLFTVHSTFSGYKLHNKILSFFNALLAYRITCVSHVSYKDYPQIIKLLKGQRIQTIQNGVDTQRIDAMISCDDNSEHEDIRFVYVARLIPIKNHLFLMDVLKKCENQIHFVFIGEEDHEKTIRKKVAEVGLMDRVTFTGLIPRDEVYKMLKQMDFYISSSTLEGLPISVLEAMYCGLQCVLSNIPQHREIAGVETVLLPFDADRWAKELTRLAYITKEQRKQMSQRITEYVTKNFSLFRMHEKYNAIYEEMR